MNTYHFRFEGKNVGIISAFQDNKNIFDNNQNSYNLFNELRSLEYDPWPFVGKFKNKKEKSFLVPNIIKKDLIYLCDKYNQEFVIWAKKIPNFGYKVHWFDSNGNLHKTEHIKNITSLILKAKKNI